MAYYLPSPGSARNGETPTEISTPISAGSDITDLKVFWGPDICRLEYLIHLVDTGRIKDEWLPEHLRLGATSG